jgi:hypothetical protein
MKVLVPHSDGCVARTVAIFRYCESYAACSACNEANCGICGFVSTTYNSRYDITLFNYRAFVVKTFSAIVQVPHTPFLFLLVLCSKITVRFNANNTPYLFIIHGTNGTYLRRDQGLANGKVYAIGT